MTNLRHTAFYEHIDTDARLTFELTVRFDVERFDPWQGGGYGVTEWFATVDSVTRFDSTGDHEIDTMSRADGTLSEALADCFSRLIRARAETNDVLFQAINAKCLKSLEDR